MLSQELIGILKEEYVRHQVCITDGVNLVTQQKPNLAKHMGIDNVNQSMLCTKCCNKHLRKPCIHCGKNNHITNKCKLLGKLKCGTCSKFLHTAKDCWNKPGKKKSKNEIATPFTSNSKRQKTGDSYGD